MPFQKGNKLRLGKHPTEEVKLKISNTLMGSYVGDKATNWKGGRFKNAGGYIAIYMPNHPFCVNGRYILESRLIMEQHIKRYLTPDEVVHHKNGIVDDNSIENLTLFENQKEHASYHRKQGALS